MKTKIENFFQDKIYYTKKIENLSENRGNFMYSQKFQYENINEENILYLL